MELAWCQRGIVKMKSAIPIITASLLFVSSFLPAAGQTQPHQDFRVAPAVLEGSPVPGVDGSRFRHIGSTVSNRGSDIAFTGSWYDNLGREQSGVFLTNRNAILKIAMTGDPVPGVHGMVFVYSFASFGQIAINESGAVVISTRILLPEVPPRPVTGLFLFDNGILTNLMTTDTAFGMSINNKSDVAFYDGASVRVRAAAGGISTIVTSGQAVPGVSGASFTGFYGASINSSVQVAFLGYYSATGQAGFGSGIFLYSRNAITPVVLSAQVAPGISDRVFEILELGGLDEAGKVLFAGDRDCSTLPVGPFRPACIERFGLYLNSGANITPVVVKGQAAPGGVGGTVGDIFSFDLNNSGTVAFSLGIKGDVAPSRTFIFSDGVYLPSAFYLTGDPPANAAELFQEPGEPGPRLVTGSNAMLFRGAIPDGRGNLRLGAFLAFPITANSVPPDDFETKGEGDLPAGWQTVWSNSGSGGASQFNTGGQAAYSGSSVLRLHVGPAGGSTFILSDPLDVAPDQFYVLSAQMRYALAFPSEAAAFTVLQYDSAGNEIAINELDGVAGDNFWTWKSKALCIRTLTNAVTIRIRFGLTAAEEAYLDVDAIR